MKRMFKILALIIVGLIGLAVLKSCDFGPPSPRPDLDLPLAPQMVDPSSAPLDMNVQAVNPMAAQGVNPVPVSYTHLTLPTTPYV